MGKTYRRDQQYRPKKHGQVFVKDKNWKQNKNKEVKPEIEPVPYSFPENE